MSKRIVFFKLLLVIAIFFANKLVCTVLTDLLDTPCQQTVSNCQHCKEQQFQTLLCVHYTIFSVVKLDLFTRALLLYRILALEKTTRTPGVHIIMSTLSINSIDVMAAWTLIIYKHLSTRQCFRHCQALCIYIFEDLEKTCLRNICIL